MGLERCRWRDAEGAELALMTPRLRKREEKSLAKTDPATGNVSAVGKGPSDDEPQSDAAKQPSPPQPSRRRLFQNLEFRGVCVQNKAGQFPCPTVGKLLERGASLDVLS